MAKREWPMRCALSERVRDRCRVLVDDRSTSGHHHQRWWVRTEEMEKEVGDRSFGLETLTSGRTELTGSIYDRFFSLRQTESVQDYCQKFESLAATMGTMGDQGLQAVFVNGLKMEIQGPLRLLHPNGLIRAMELSESIEANQALVRNHRVGPNKPFTIRPNPLIILESRVPYVTPSPTYSTTTVHSKSTSTSSSSFPTSFKRFTEVELREKKERGVCFKCDGRWFRGHECKEAELVVVVVQD
uniref:Retrotransposon gag domain-containing protein n=1 Tax=Cannabis sativa TaxID=3483 RepID=A0A803PI16_CANSA